MSVFACWMLVGTLAAELAAEPSSGRVEGALVTVLEESEVPARDSGVLTAVPAREGEIVVAGALLAQIEDVDARLVLARAAAEAKIAESTAKNDVDVRFARKAAEVAQAELRRSKESIERFERSISQTELDKLILEADRCTLAVESAEQEMLVARQTLALKQAETAVAQQVVDRRRVAAPIDGVIVQVHRRRGEWVKPGDPIARILFLDRLRVEALVAADQVVGAAGRDVTFQLDAVAGRPARRFQGKLAFVSPEVDPVNGQVRIWAEIDNREHRLRPGVRGTLLWGSAEAGAKDEG